MAFQAVGPGWRQLIVEIRNQDVRPGVETTRKSFSVGRTAQRHLPVCEIGRNRRDRPLPFLHRVRPGEEVRKVAEVKLALAAFAFKQEFLAPRFEAIMQVAEEVDGLLVQKAFLGAWLSCLHMETPSGKSTEAEHC